MPSLFYKDQCFRCAVRSRPLLCFTVMGPQLEECLLWISLIFVTLRCLPPQVVRRWSDAAPVSADFLLQWRGFCSILTNAYYTHGMAW